MRTRLTALLVSGGAAALALSLGLGTGTAIASSAITWTVKPGGNITAAGAAQVKDSKTGTVAKCTTTKLTGTLKKGSGLAGAKLGTVKTAAFTGCTIATIKITVKTNGLPWSL